MNGRESERLGDRERERLGHNKRKREREERRGRDSCIYVEESVASQSSKLFSTLYRVSLSPLSA